MEKEIKIVNPKDASSGIIEINGRMGEMFIDTYRQFMDIEIGITKYEDCGSSCYLVGRAKNNKKIIGTLQGKAGYVGCWIILEPWNSLEIGLSYLSYDSKIKKKVKLSTIDPTTLFSLIEKPNTTIYVGELNNLLQGYPPESRDPIEMDLIKKVSDKRLEELTNQIHKSIQKIKANYIRSYRS